jgi:CheY-like chemotaxis protein
MQGAIGLELAREHAPDLILLDMHLPDMHGEAVLERLRADATTRDIPVIVLSADATDRQISRMTAAGVRDYLTKPLEIPRFLDALHDTLGPAQAEAA